MSPLSATVGRTRYAFAGLKDLLAKASALRSGDELAGVAARSAEERVAARRVLADVPLTRFLEEPLIPYEEDEVTRLIVDGHDRAAFEPVKGLTVVGLKDERALPGPAPVRSMGEPSGG